MRLSVFGSVFSFLFAISALAQIARPVAGIHFTGQIAPGTTRIATDGRDSLVIWQPSAGGQGFIEPKQWGLYGQRLLDGVLQPAFLIDAGSQWFRDPAIVWTGSNYVIASLHADGLYIITLSKSGRVIQRNTTPLVRGNVNDVVLARNGDRLLLTAYDESGLRGLVLSSNGQPAGGLQLFRARAAVSHSTTAAGDGWAVAIGGYLDTIALMVRRDGTVVDPAGALIEGPYERRFTSYYCARISIASNGSNIVVAWVGREARKASVLKTAVLALDGTIAKPVSTTFSMPVNTSDGGLSFLRLVPDATTYVAMLGISYEATSEVHVVDPAFLRISETGDANGAPQFVFHGTHRTSAKDLVAVAGSYLVTYTGETNQKNFGSFVASVDQKSLVMRDAPLGVGWSLAPQRVRATGVRDRDYLILWTEQGDQWMHATLMSADGRWIRSTPLNVPSTAAASVASDGSSWLITFARYSANALLLDAQLNPITEKPLPLGPGDSIAATWSGGAYVVVFSDGSLRSATLSRDLKLLSVNTLIESRRDPADSHFTITYRSPSVAASENSLLATFEVSRTADFLTPGGVPTSSYPAAVGLDALAGMTSQIIRLAENGDGTVVAAGADRFAVVWNEMTGWQGALFENGGAEIPATRFILDNDWLTGPVRLAWDGVNFFAGWQRQSSIVAARILVSGRVDAHVIIQPDHGGTLFDAAVAAGPSADLLVAFTERSESSENLWRPAFLFAKDLQTQNVPPDPPILRSVSFVDHRSADISWEPQRNVFGYEIEAVSQDGRARTVDVVSPASISASVSLTDLDAMTLRVRSWNRAGVSAAPVGKTRAVRHH